jgi:hypothetical protein
VSDVPLYRLYLLRAVYLIIAVGLIVMIWPGLLAPPGDLGHMRGVVWALLGALGLLALLGLRYPLQMLPLLLFELAWKLVWIATIGLPRWAAQTLDAAHRATLGECLFGVVLCLVAIPWGYVLRNYVRRPGDAWRRAAAPGAVEPARL